MENRLEKAINLVKEFNITLINETQISVQMSKVQLNNNAETIKAYKADIIEYLTEKKAKEELRIKRISEIEGIDDIQNAINEWDRYNYAFNKAMNRGDCFFPSQPHSNIEEEKAKYPRATAYLLASKWAQASHFEKADAGSKAVERIIAGEDYEEVLKEMREEWAIVATNGALNS